MAEPRARTVVTKRGTIRKGGKPGPKPPPGKPKGPDGGKQAGGGSAVPAKGHVFNLPHCEWVQITMPVPNEDHEWTVDIFPYPGAEFEGDVHVLVASPNADGSAPTYDSKTPGDKVTKNGSTVKRKVKKGDAIYLHYTNPHAPATGGDENIKADVSAK